jgi:hypothetical protein
MLASEFGDVNWIGRESGQYCPLAGSCDGHNERSYCYHRAVLRNRLPGLFVEFADNWGGIQNFISFFVEDVFVQGPHHVGLCRSIFKLRSVTYLRQTLYPFEYLLFIEV